MVWVSRRTLAIIYPPTDPMNVPSPSRRAVPAPPVKSGGELFIVDNSDEAWKGLRYLQDWTEIASAFDIATGYFEIGSLLALDGKWQKLDKIRILMGNEVSSRSRSHCHWPTAGSRVKAPEGWANSRTLRARGGHGCRASVWECGGPPPLSPRQARLRSDYRNCHSKAARR